MSLSIALADMQCPRKPIADQTLAAETIDFGSRKRELYAFLDDWFAKYESAVGSFVAPSCDTTADNSPATGGVGACENLAPQPTSFSLEAARVAGDSVSSPRMQELRSPSDVSGASSVSQIAKAELTKTKTVKVVNNLSSASQFSFRTGSDDSDSEIGFVENKVRQMDHEIEVACEDVEPKACARFCQLLARLENHACFQLLSTFIIFVNTVFIAYTTHRAVKDISDKPGESYKATVESFDLSFNLFYFFEVVLRIVVLRVDFVFGPDVNWNLFDLALAVSWLSQTILKSQGQHMANSSYLRLLRLVKMMKLLRVIKAMRFFRELRLVLDSITGSMKTMVWAVLLVLTLTFIFGTCFVNAAADLLISVPDPNDISHADLHYYWGTLDRAMVALFMAPTGGTDWSDVAEPLRACGLQYYYIFLFYIAFFAFVMVNTLTSLFVEGVRRYAELDESDVINDELARKGQYIKKIKSLYIHMDTDGSGFVQYDHFIKYLGDPRMQAFASSLEIEASNLDQFFAILSVNGTRAVDIDTFVEGCIKLRGLARSMDMMDVMVSVRNTRQELHELHRLVKRKLKQKNGDIDSRHGVSIARKLQE